MRAGAHPILLPAPPSWPGSGSGGCPTADLARRRLGKRRSLLTAGGKPGSAARAGYFTRSGAAVSALAGNVYGIR